MNLDEFINLYDDTYLEFDGAFKYQCQDLAKAWEAENGWPVVSGNAYQVIDNAPKDFYEVVGTPQRGDIVVWGQGAGLYGHIAVYISGDTSSFTSFDQNWPVGSPCHLQTHNYTNITGYLRPKKETTMTRGKLEELETTMSVTDQHQHACNWAMKSINLKDPTESEVIALSQNGDITSVRKGLLKTSCAKNYPCPSCDCKKELAEQNSKLNTYCETKVKQQADQFEKETIKIMQEHQAFAIKADEKVKELEEKLKKCNAEGLDYYSGADLIKLGVKKWLGIS